MTLPLSDLTLYRQLVWTDYRLALLFLVFVPLTLSIWAFVRQNEPIQRLFLIYWRVSSLLAITVYLMIAAFPFSYLVGTLARVLIPLSLWFWLDLNEEIHDQRWSSLKWGLSIWRWAATGYCSLGVLLQLPTLRCAFLPNLLADDFCVAWLNPPWGLRELIHGSYKPGFLGFWGIVGLVIYLLYFGHFLIFRLGRQGRFASWQ